MGRNRGQAAIEYILTYGWVVLLVMLVYIVLLHLGVLEPKVGMSLTASDFSTLKPILASCSVGSNNWNPPESDVKGFTCTFINAAGTNIWVRDVTVTLTKLGDQPQVCPVNVVASKSEEGGITTTSNDWILLKNVPASGVPTYFCYQNDPDAGSCSNVVGDGKQSWQLKKDTEFVVLGLGTSADPTCFDLKSTDRFSFKIDIEYAIDLGAAYAVKHAIGTVRNA